MIKLVFFASLREALGCESLEMEFKEPLRLSEMIKQVEEKRKALGQGSRRGVSKNCD